MSFMNSGDFAGPEEMMIYLDDESPGLVDYCNSRRDEYL